MFYDAIEVGGSAGQAGQRASLFASKIALLRARRRTVSMPFRWLCLTMHASIVVLLIFITEVIMAFAGMVEQANETIPSISGAPSMSSLTSFNLSGLELMHSLVMPLILIFTVSNAIAPTIAEGGSKLKILNNLAVTAAISGISLLTLPALADTLFKTTSQM
jgi:archaellum biogenesis protein FlaJ (TadC family)